MAKRIRRLTFMQKDAGLNPTPGGHTEIPLGKVLTTKLLLDCTDLNLSDAPCIAALGKSTKVEGVANTYADTRL